MSVSSQPKYNDDVITDIAELPEVEQTPASGPAIAPASSTPVDDNVETEAPNVRTNRMQALQELDQELGYSVSTSQLDGIDLSLLTSQLLPQDACADPDVAWDYDGLFTEVSTLDNANDQEEEEKPSSP